MSVRNVIAAATLPAMMASPVVAAGDNPAASLSLRGESSRSAADEANQQVNRDTFDLFYYLIHKRLFYGRSTLADSTALQRNARQRLLDIAANHHYATCLLLFNVSFALRRR